MLRASRGFRDCQVPHILGTGTQCLGQLAPLHQPLHLLGGYNVLSRSLRGLLSHPPTSCSQPLSHCSHTTQHKVGAEGETSFKPPAKDWLLATPTLPAPGQWGKQQPGKREGDCGQQLQRHKGTWHFNHRATELTRGNWDHRGWGIWTEDIVLVIPGVQTMVLTDVC